jgi:PAS domain S-box-containing protein
MISTQTAMAGSYDYRTVALSVLMAIAASYAALDLAGRVTAASGWVRSAWLVSGAGAMGLGIWSMHFIAMLAFSLPVPISYHWATVLLSLLAAIFAAAAALHVVSRVEMSFAQAVVGGSVMGLGIVAMHYIGMAAMRLSAVSHFDLRIVTLSVVVAIVFSVIALLLAFDLREETRETTPRKIGSALTVAAGICLMHYTGMAAVRFMPAAIMVNLSHALSISALSTAAIGTVTLLVLGLAVLTSSVDRRFHAQALGQSEVNYRSLVERSPYGIFRSTPDGKLLMVNPALVRMLGHDSEAELLRANLARHVYVDPAERERIIEQHLKTDLMIDRELLWKRKDGQQITVRANGQVIRDETGRLECFEVIVENITERKLQEDQARQSQKMEAIGQFAGGIAHDFNNLLLVILGQSQFVLKKIDPGDSRYTRLQEIQRAAERAQWLTAQLMIFARRGKLELQRIDLNSALQELRELLERLMGEDIVLVTELSPTLGRVQSDHGLIQQVIMNLAANARDAMPGGGILKIATENVGISETPAAQHRGVPAGRYVVLTVSDSGTGMDAATQARLFEPFFTTKEAGKGTGLGLAVVRSIVAQSGGQVTVQSELARGSTFKVFLPVVEPAEQAQPAKQREEVSPRGSETVLLVEDAQSVRIVIRDYLESGGYIVLEAETSGRALEFAQKHPGPIHLLLTDVVMPGMGGVELAREIRSIRPDIKMLYMSGYAPRAAGSEGLEESTSFLQKPFTPEELLRRVRRVLDKAKS